MRSRSALHIVSSVICAVVIKIFAGPRTNVGRITGRAGSPSRPALACKRTAHGSRWLRARTTVPFGLEKGRDVGYSGFASLGWTRVRSVVLLDALSVEMRCRSASEHCLVGALHCDLQDLRWPSNRRWEDHWACWKSFTFGPRAQAHSSWQPVATRCPGDELEKGRDVECSGFASLGWTRVHSVVLLDALSVEMRSRSASEHCLVGVLHCDQQDIRWPANRRGEDHWACWKSFTSSPCA
ncbi:unnamed protein product [Peniophora sp. CBMAI 1063]|nr:unnamed protein product [Peniophora sp. CBMAI 1063]